MTSEVKTISASKGAYRLGFQAAVLTAVLSVAAFAVGIATPGPIWHLMIPRKGHRL